MNLVLGAVKGLEMEHIAPFLFSLFRAGFTGKVVFFVSQTSDRTCAMLEKLNVTLISVDESDVFTNTPVNSLRYFIYEQYLAGMDEDIENVMVADVRDIVFQRNPFDIEIESTLCCFLEDKASTLGSSVINAGWLAAAYGKEVLESLGQNYVCCSGFTLGPVAMMREYISTMVAGLRAVDERVPNIMHVIGGVDQAVHNFLLYTKALPEARLFDNEDGPVLTLNYVPPECIQLNDAGQVLNGVGDVVHVLHQYDRLPELAEHLLKQIDAASVRNHQARAGAPSND